MTQRSKMDYLPVQDAELKGLKFIFALTVVVIVLAAIL